VIKAFVAKSVPVVHSVDSLSRASAASGRCPIVQFWYRMSKLMGDDVSGTLGFHLRINKSREGSIKQETHTALVAEVTPSIKPKSPFTSGGHWRGKLAARAAS
jgi:hypothetical protein